MSVYVEADGTIVLQGVCGSDDAEPLLQGLLSASEAVVDWHQCSAAHSAVLQVLAAASPILRGTPRGAELARWADPALRRLG
jgi:hypothetical protein